MGGAKKKGVVGAASLWPDHSYNHQDHDQHAHAAAMLTETVELKQIIDRTQRLPPRELFMSSVKDLAAKVRDRAGSNSNECFGGQNEALQQIQGMLNKQTEEIKALQHSTQLCKGTNSPLVSRPSGHARSYRDATLASHLTSTEPSMVSG